MASLCPTTCYDQSKFINSNQKCWFVRNRKNNFNSETHQHIIINFSLKRGETNLVMNGKGPTKRNATAMNMLPTMETADGYLMRSQIWKFLLFLKKLYVFKILLIFWNKIMFLISDLLKKLIFELYFCNNSVVNYKTGEWDFLTFTQEEETLFYKLLQDL